MTAQTQSQDQTVTFDLPEYKNETGGELDGCMVRVEYNSSFGGTQTVEGTAEKIQEWDKGRRRTYLKVGDRKISSGRVLSVVDGRKIGKVESITVTMQSENAIEWIAKDWNAHDVDTHDDEIYVQFWSGQ